MVACGSDRKSVRMKAHKFVKLVSTIAFAVFLITILSDIAHSTQPASLSFRMVRSVGFETDGNRLIYNQGNTDLEMKIEAYTVKAQEISFTLDVTNNSTSPITIATEKLIFWDYLSFRDEHSLEQSGSGISISGSHCREEYVCDIDPSSIRTFMFGIKRAQSIDKLFWFKFAPYVIHASDTICMGEVSFIIEPTESSEGILSEWPRKLTNKVMDAWRKRDGAVWFYVMPALLDINIIFPNLFYESMQSDTVGFKHYLSSLKYPVFTNQSDTVTTFLDEMRLDVIDRMSNLEVNPQYKSYHQSVLDTLRNIKVGFID